MRVDKRRNSGRQFSVSLRITIVETKVLFQRLDQDLRIVCRQDFNVAELTVDGTASHLDIVDLVGRFLQLLFNLLQHWAEFTKLLLDRGKNLPHFA